MIKMFSSLLIATGLLIASDIVSVADNVKELKSINLKQRSVLFASFRYGFNKDFGYTMAGIGWQESKNGRDRINLSDPSFGIYHNLLGSVINREGVRNTAYYRNKYANKLVQNDEFARSQALSELLYWESYHLRKSGRAGLWQKTVRSYNAGGSYNCKEADNYYINIKNKIEALKQVHFFDSYSKMLCNLKSK